MATTRVFKSGNSMAIRLPKSLGLKAGTEMRVLEERGRYVLEPVERERKIDLTGIFGSIPEFPDLRPEDRIFEERDLGSKGG
jgi:antitoxin VapB